MSDFIKIWFKNLAYLLAFIGFISLAILWIFFCLSFGEIGIVFAIGSVLLIAITFIAYDEWSWKR